MNTERDAMVAEMAAYFDKIKAAITAGGSSAFRYLTGTVPASGQVVIDTVAALGYTVAAYEVYSLGIELRCKDPTITTNPPVIDAGSVLTYQIAADGKVTILNNYAGVVTYHARITMPVKK